MRHKFLDLKGQRFGKLVAIEFVGRKGNSLYWKCQCDCGSISDKRKTHLLSGDAKSCGCNPTVKNMADPSKRHGLTDSKIYKVWSGMIERCRNPNRRGYKNYGGKGIKVCDRWHDFNLFYSDFGHLHKEGLSIDRYPNKEGNYEPGNVRWATKAEQDRNKTNNRYLEYNGTKMILSDWARKLGIGDNALHGRLKNGWSVEKALSTPKQ